MRGWLLVFSGLVLAGGVQAQQTWTLEACLDSALNNNVRLSQIDLTTAGDVINYQQTKYDFTPSISSSAGHSYFFGRSLDPVTNEFTQNNLQNSNFNLNGNLALFNGLARYYGLKYAKLSVENGVFNQKIAQRNLKLEVLTFYLQALLSQDLIRLSNDHLNYTLAEEERMQLLIEAENRTQVDLIEILSQKSRDELALIRAKNDWQIAMQQLRQSMQVKNPEAFAIDTTANEIFMDTSVFEPVENMPEIQQQDLLLEQAILSKKISQGSYFPTLSLQAGVGSSYSDGYFLADPITGNLYLPNFNEQFSSNLYQSVSFSLYIPIYNKHQTRTNVQLSQLAIDRVELERERLIWDLIGVIEQLKTDINNAAAELESATVLLTYAQQDFDQTELRYNAGQINYTELLNKKDRLFSAQSNLVQSKYNYYFKRKIATFYND